MCPVPLDSSPTADICTGGGSAGLCVDTNDPPTVPLFLDLSRCQNDTAGIVLDGAPAAVQTDRTTFCLNLEVHPVGDSSTATLVGSVSFEEPTLAMCFPAVYHDLEVTIDNMISNLSGNVSGCEDARVFGFPFVAVPDLNTQMEYTFFGSTAVVTVNTLDLHEFIAHCTIEPNLDSEPVCVFSPPR